MAAKRKRVRLLLDDEDTTVNIATGSVLYSNYKFKTILNDELLSQMCVLLEEGLPASTACEYLCISQSTHFRWLTQGRQYLAAIEEELTPPKPEWELYAIYLIEVRRSISIYLKEKIESVNGDFTPSWVRDITILERRDYQNWGRNVTVTERDESKNPDESFL